MSTGSTGAIRQGRAFVELFTDDTKLKQGLRLAENTVRKFGASVSRIGAGMMGAGAAILAPLGLAVREYAKAGAELKEMSERTGIAVETLSELKYAASQTGASMEDLEKGIRLSQKVLGSSLGAKALAGLGIDAAKLKALSPEEQFIALADAIGKIPAQADRASAAMKLFGRGGAALLPFLNEGREGIAKLREEARRLGLVMSDADATAADEFDDSLARVRQQVLRLVGSIGASLVPALNQFGQWLSRGIPRLRAWVDEHRGWIVLAARAALAAVGLGAALWTMGKIVMFVSVAFAAMRVAITIVSGLWAVLAGGAKAIAFITGMVQGLTVAVTAARTAILGLATSAGIAEAVIALWPAIFLAALGALLYFPGGFQEMGRVFKQVWSGISDAIAAGDIELGMKILWAGVRLIWTEALYSVYDFFVSMLTGVRQALAYIGGGVIVGVMYLCQGIHWLWTELWTRVANGWTEMWSRLKTSIIAAKNWLGIMSDAEASAAIKAEVETRTKIITERQNTRASEHAEDAQRVEDAKQALENRLNDLQKWNDEVVSGHDEEVQRLKDELAALSSEARAKKEAMKVNPETGPLPGMAQPDIYGGAARADAVVGGFDIGAIMSFQAGASDSKLERIAIATEATAAALEDRQNDDSEWGG
jgi:hypothetical protein